MVATRQREIDLTIQGMTCAACVGRVEKRLDALPGVSAEVNLATEQAHVSAPEDTSIDELIEAVERAGYGARLLTDSGGVDTSAPIAERGLDLRRRLVVASVLTAPVLVISMIPALQFTGWQWVVAALSLPVTTWAAWPFHRAAARAARHRTSTMDTLVSIGVIAAMVWSLWALLLGGAGELGMRMEMTLLPRAGIGEHSGHHTPELYFEVAAVVVTFLLAGRYAEHRARRRSGDALRSLLELGAKQARVVRAGKEKLINADKVRVGDIMSIKPGEKVPTDGVVIEGHSALDEAMITGESIPVEVGPGSAVVGATINASGHLLVEATRIGSDTTLAQLGRLVTQAQLGKAPIQRLADRISAVFVPIVIGLAITTLAIWLAIGGLGTANVQAAFTAAVAVLIIACPCALGLATPTALLVGTGRAAQSGIVIKGPQILESTRRVDTAVFDKTGTITTGEMTVTDSHGSPVSWLLAGVVEARSEHPIAAAIATRYASDPRWLNPPTPTDFINHAGLGISATLDLRPEQLTPDLWDDSLLNAPGSTSQADQSEASPGTITVLVGRLSWLLDQGYATGSDTADSKTSISPFPGDGVLGTDVDVHGMETRGVDVSGHGHHGEAQTAHGTLVAIGWNGRIHGTIEVADGIKAESRQAIAEVKKLGITPVLLTGDSGAVAHRVASEVGIETVIAEVLPEGKLTEIQRLQASGAVVAMVGDGVNDAAALAAADLGFAMGSGTDVAINASDITVMNSDPRQVPQAIRYSQRVLRTIKQNLVWAFGYNVAAIPLAGLGFLNPMIAGLAMALSSVMVVSNSLRLRRMR